MSCDINTKEGYIVPAIDLYSFDVIYSLMTESNTEYYVGGDNPDITW